MDLLFFARSSIRNAPMALYRVSGQIALLETLGIVDARITEDAVWTLPSLRKVKEGDVLIVRNATAYSITVVADPEDTVGGFRDVAVPAESCSILSAEGSRTWRVLVSVSSRSDLLPGSPTEFMARAVPPAEKTVEKTVEKSVEPTRPPMTQIPSSRMAPVSQSPQIEDLRKNAPSRPIPSAQLVPMRGVAVPEPSVRVAQGRVNMPMTKVRGPVKKV